MNPRFVALATVLDVAVLVGLGVGLFFAPLTLVWAFEDGFSTELLSSWAVAVQGWFLGHGVPLAVSLPLELSESLGLGVSGQSFRVDVALLGIALLTLLWGYRIGAREGTKKHPLLTWFLAVGMMVGLSFLLVFFLPKGSVSIDLVDALLRPAVFLSGGLALATWAGPDTAGRELIRERFPRWLSAIVRTGFAAGIGALLAMVGVAAIVVSILLVVSFAPVISLYESLQPGAYGIIALSIGQLALLPTVVVWVFSWLVGPGFTLGTGAVVSPLGTSTDALPALPLAGILPGQAPAGALAVIAVPMGIAFAMGLLSRSRLMGANRGGLWRGEDTAFIEQPAIMAVLAAVIAALVASAGALVLSELARGELGPGRFSEVGPDPWSVVLWWGAQVFVGVVLGLLSGGLAEKRVSSRR